MKKTAQNRALQMTARTLNARHPRAVRRITAQAARILVLGTSTLALMGTNQELLAESLPDAEPVDAPRAQRETDEPPLVLKMEYTLSLPSVKVRAAAIQGMSPNDATVGTAALASHQPKDSENRNRRMFLASLDNNFGDSWLAQLAPDQPPTGASTKARKVDMREFGRIWLTEDPGVLKPALSVSATDKAAIEHGTLRTPIKFSIYTNYAAFLSRAEIRVYARNAFDRVNPIAVLPVNVKGGSNQMSLEWSGKRDADGQSSTFEEGDVLQYVLRVYDAQARWDETRPAAITLVSDIEKTRALDALNQAQSLVTLQQSRQVGLKLEDYVLETSVIGRNDAVIQNIPLRGSNVRMHGQEVPLGLELKINDQKVFIDLERKFVSEYLLPIGPHRFDVAATDANGRLLQAQLETDVRGEYWFMVGLADLTLSQNKFSGNVEMVTSDDLKRFDGEHAYGRLAFYLKGKIQGKYLLTGHADTLEREGQDLFQGFFKADRNDILRRIDPDAYYPVYGDDSVPVLDADTSGRLYVRLDWDKSNAVWGNFRSEINPGEWAAYNRSLYGAKLEYRSLESTPLGVPRTQVKAFAANAQTAAGRSEFIGTGGSLYFMRHTDIVPGSAVLSLEERDPDSGRVIQTTGLQPGLDYEIDYFQGRVILTRPLQQVSSTSSILRDRPLSGNLNALVAVYEFYPETDSDNTGGGVNARQWLGDKVAVGATYVKENRSGQDFELKGVDLTYQAGTGTYVKLEHAHTESELAPVFHSTDGGLSFSRLGRPISVEYPTDNGLTSAGGNANGVELRVNAQELGLTQNPWLGSAWWRKKDAGFAADQSTALGLDSTDAGVRLVGQLTPALQLSAGYKTLETVGYTLANGDQLNNLLGGSLVGTHLYRLERAHLGLHSRMQDGWKYEGEIQSIKLTDNAVSPADAHAGLLGLRVTRRVRGNLDVYAGAQASFSEENYDKNNALRLGAKYSFSSQSNAFVEASKGDRGDAVLAGAEYRRTDAHTIYGNYIVAPGQSATPTGVDSVVSAQTFNPLSGFTLGQHVQLNERWRLSNESQWLTDPTASGQVNSLGLDFAPKIGWNLGASLQKGELTNSQTSAVTDREAVSVFGGYTDAKFSWSSKIEHRRDQIKQPSDAGTSSNLLPSGTEQTQWLSTNRASYKVTDDWRVLGKLNYSVTQSSGKQAGVSDLQDAKLTDTSLGLAWRPAQGRLNLLAKVRYLYDLAPKGQINVLSSQVDQKSEIYSTEATYEIGPTWEVAGKLAQRSTYTRLERGVGDWFSNNANYAAGQVRWHFGDRGTDAYGQVKDLWHGWSAMAEYRMLEVQSDGVKKGALVSLDKDLGKSLRFGIGYNFTDFSSDLSQLQYRSGGWFVNLVGRF